MKLNEIFSQTDYYVEEISRSDSEMLQAFADFYNESGQLSWKLNVSKLKGKLGSRGLAYGLFADGELVGTIGLKQTDIQGYRGAEIGYLMIDEEHRSFRNLMMLYKQALRGAKRFDIVFVTTNIKNRPINVLLTKTNKIEKILKIKSPYSSNKLYVWQSLRTNGDVPRDERYEVLRQHFIENIISEYGETEDEISPNQ